jgi:hypothetical protein
MLFKLLRRRDFCVEKPEALDKQLQRPGGKAYYIHDLLPGEYSGRTRVASLYH